MPLPDVAVVVAHNLHPPALAAARVSYQYSNWLPTCPRSSPTWVANPVPAAKGARPPPRLRPSPSPPAAALRHAQATARLPSAAVRHRHCHHQRLCLRLRPDMRRTPLILTGGHGLVSLTLSEPLRESGTPRPATILMPPATWPPLAPTPMSSPMPRDVGSGLVVRLVHVVRAAARAVWQAVVPVQAQRVASQRCPWMGGKQMQRCARQRGGEGGIVKTVKGTPYRRTRSATASALRAWQAGRILTTVWRASTLQLHRETTIYALRC